MAMAQDYAFSIRLMITSAEDPKVGFGPGIAQLLQGIETTGSLNQAAKEMHMAYSKAWRVIREVEKALGFALIYRKGAHGSVLTPQGARTLAAFYEMEKSAQAAVRGMFDRFVEDIRQISD